MKTATSVVTMAAVHTRGLVPTAEGAAPTMEPLSRCDLVTVGPGFEFRPRVGRPLPLPVYSTNSAYRVWAT
jgi:hypothetical protein